MAANSKISWTDATWNPVRGCTRVSEGCRNCYAEKIAARFSGPGQPYEGLAKRVVVKSGPGQFGNDARWTGVVREVGGDTLTDPLRWKKPRRVFVNSMSDLFHEALSDEAIDRVFAVMALAPRHTFQVLTKRPERMRAYMNDRGHHDKIAASWNWNDHDKRGADNRNAGLWPFPNVWLGTSVEDQATADARIPLLLETPAAVRFVSYEPALRPVDFTRLGHNAVNRNALTGMLDGPGGTTLCRDALPGLDWIIIGAESGPNRRPFQEDWARSARDACQKAGVAFFFKQNHDIFGKKVETPLLDGKRWTEYP